MNHSSFFPSSNSIFFIKCTIILVKQIISFFILFSMIYIKKKFYHGLSFRIWLTYPLKLIIYHILVHIKRFSIHYSKMTILELRPFVKKGKYSKQHLVRPKISVALLNYKFNYFRLVNIYQ